jgi:hypothetical protein
MENLDDANTHPMEKGIFLLFSAQSSNKFSVSACTKALLCEADISAVLGQTI